MTSTRPVAVELHDVPHSDPWKTIQLGARLISPKVGLIRAISYGIHMPQDSVFLALGAGNADLSHFSAILNADKAGGGGESLETALAATIGEAVERYCMLFYDKREMVRAPYTEVAEHAVCPDELRLYRRDQVEMKPDSIRLDYFDEDLAINWVWAYSLTHEIPRLVPATLVYMQYKLDESEGAPGRNASSGLAAGATLEEAILTGLFEVVERDAFTIAWLHRQVRTRINIDLPELQDVLRKRFFLDHPSVDFQIYDITLDVPIFSVFGILRRPAEFGPVLCVSSVSRLNPKEAIRKAMREVGQGMPYLRFLRLQLKEWEPSEDFSDLTSFDHHFTHYSKRSELIPKALAFCDGVPEVALSSLPDRSSGRVLGDINACIEMLRNIGKEVIVADITTPEIRDLGLHVVRVIVPGLVPLHGNHNFPYLGVKRLYEIPERMGWTYGAWNAAEGFNPFPHPFP
jgi:ribosomal protein S12 methylthiotransferase accessory factor